MARPGPGTQIHCGAGLGHGVGFREGGWYFADTLKSASTAGDLQTIARFSHSDFACCVSARAESQLKPFLCCTVNIPNKSCFKLCDGQICSAAPKPAWEGGLEPAQGHQL